MPSPPVGCPPRSSTASLCCTSTSPAWNKSLMPSPSTGSARLADVHCGPPATARHGQRRPEPGLHTPISTLPATTRPFTTRCSPAATTLRFAAQDTPPQLTAAFAELHQAVGVIAERAGCGRAHRGVLGRTARTGHPQPCRPTTPGLRLGPRRPVDRPVLLATRNDALSSDRCLVRSHGERRASGESSGNRKVGGLRPSDLSGVADGTRTRDSQDHNLVLYQLNYSHHRR